MFFSFLEEFQRESVCPSVSFFYIDYPIKTVAIDSLDIYSLSSMAEAVYHPKPGNSGMLCLIILLGVYNSGGSREVRVRGFPKLNCGNISKNCKKISVHPKFSGTMPQLGALPW